jgi:hypothetical protein
MRRQKSGQLGAELVSRAAFATAANVVVCPHCYVLHYAPVGSQPAAVCAACGMPLERERP